MNIEYKQSENTVNLSNMIWADYSDLMISLDTLINQLENQTNNISIEIHRKQLLARYKRLFESMKLDSVPWRGQAISLDDNVIKATR